MKTFNSSLQITTFDVKLSENFINKVKLLGAKKPYADFFEKSVKNQLQYTKKVIRKKNTILRSPHVNKKARDQIEVQHVSYTFRTKSKFRWLLTFFFIYLKKTSYNSIKFDFKVHYSQNVFYIPLK